MRTASKALLTFAGICLGACVGFCLQGNPCPATMFGILAGFFGLLASGKEGGRGRQD